MKEITLYEYCGETLEEKKLEALSSDDKKVLTNYHNERKIDFLDGKIKARQYIGVIQLSKLRVKIFPKITEKEDPQTILKGLGFMMLYAHNIKLTPGKITEFEKCKDLLDLIIVLYTKQVEKLFKHGINRGYTKQEENLNILKGRILIKENIQHNLTLKNKVFCSYSQFTSDILENRIIKYVLSILIRCASKHTIRREIYLLLSLLEGVKLDIIHPHVFSKLTYTRLTQRYKPVLEASKTLIQNIKIEEGLLESTKKFRYFSYLINMNDLYQNFIAGYLKNELRYNVKIQSPKIFAEVDKSLYVQPDIVLKCKNEEIIVDTKYKKPPTGVGKDKPASDVYQVFAYSHAFKCKKAILLFPQYKNHEEYKYQIKDTDKEIYIKTVNLRNLDREKERFKRELEDKIKEVLT